MGRPKPAGEAAGEAAAGEAAAGEAAAGEAAGAAAGEAAHATVRLVVWEGKHRMVRRILATC